jgi:sigma-B regulation protein RsbU (phosphoserine phosphatase)
MKQSGMAYSGNVLVIDDDPGRASELADLASTAGFTTTIASSLESSSASLGEGSDWDVVLCDVQATPEAWAADGASLRELDVQVPVMMFSNESRSASMMRALRLGANDFFATPVRTPRRCSHPWSAACACAP